MKPLAVFLAVLACAACDTTGPPGGGVYRATIDSPNGAEGAASVSVSGGGIEQVTSASGQVFSQITTSGARVVIVREPAGALEFDVKVSPGHGAPTAEVLEIADGADQVRPTLSGYRVTLVKAEAQR